MNDSFHDDRELEAWRQAYRALQAPGSLACPSDDQLMALVQTAMDAAERERLADHIVECQHCTARYRVLICTPRGVADEQAEEPSSILPPPETAG